jgi:hypothetical protein
MKDKMAFMAKDIGELKEKLNEILSLIQTPVNSRPSSLQRGKLKAQKEKHQIQELSPASVETKESSNEIISQWDCSKLKKGIGKNPFLNPRISWFKGNNCYRVRWVPGSGKKKNHNLPKWVDSKEAGDALIANFIKTEIASDTDCLRKR